MGLSLLLYSLTSIAKADWKQPFRAAIDYSQAQSSYAGTYLKQKARTAQQTCVQAAHDTKEAALCLKKDLRTAWDGKLHPIHNINFIMAALGDSITQGINASGNPTTAFDLNLVHYQLNLNPLAHPELSWSTGDETKEKVQSHWQRLSKMGLGVVKALNVAQHSTESVALPDQAEKILKFYTPHYVTILSGANDLCTTWPGQEEEKFERFKASFLATLERFKHKREQVKILLLGIPDLRRIYEMGSQDAFCTQVWKAWRFCRPLLSKSATSEERETVYRLRNRMNHFLKDLADRYPNQVKYVSKTAEGQFERRHVSMRIDCFHPSVEGQNALAEAAWQEGWFKN